MGFPFSHESQVQTTSTDSVEVVCEELVQGLLALRADEVTCQLNTVLFNAGLFRFVTNWNLLTFIREGQIQIESNGSSITARYRLGFEKYFWLTVTMVLLVFGSAM